MENITAYDLAIIAGGFTVVGALIGALVAYWLSIKLSDRQRKATAIANFRSVFIPVVAQIKIEQKYGRTTEVNRILTDTFVPMSVAIETFTPFVPSKDREAYQQAWDNYSPLAGIAQFSEYTMRENLEDANAPFNRFFNNVQAILNHVL